MRSSEEHGTGKEKSFLFRQHSQHVTLPSDGLLSCFALPCAVTSTLEQFLFRQRALPAQAGAWLQLHGIFPSRGQEQLQVHVMLRATLPEPPPSSGGPSAYKMSLLLSHPTFPRTQAQAVGGKWMRRQEDHCTRSKCLGLGPPWLLTVCLQTSYLMLGFSVLI